VSTLPRHICTLGAILFAVGCGADANKLRNLAEGAEEGGGGLAGSTNNNAGNHNKGGGGNASTAQSTKGKGGTTSSTSSTSEEGGSDGSGGRSGSGGRTGAKGGSGGDETGGRGEGGASSAKGGAVGKGGSSGTGGTSSGTGGKGTGGGPAAGGRPGTGGGPAAGGGPGTGGGSGSTEVDCSAAMPTGGTLHSGNGQGGKDNLAWQIWSNGGSGSLTTFSVPAFTAAWNNSGDYLGRLGFEWGNAGKAYTAYGTIKAQYVFKKNGSAGAYSYVGVYGWSTNPCIEWYIVEDSFSAMPFNTGDPVSGTADIDGGTYNLVKRNTNGTGGNRCGNVTNWDQFYSIRKKGSQCGTITISEHFKTWDARGWKLGNLLEVKILVEAASGSGSVDFPIANVTTSQ
jgi:endo-1,4-beta-xylanase